MPTMPDVVGLNLQDATASLETAGVLVLNSIGYFGTWPITVDWEPFTAANPFETVTAQSPSSGATVTANQAVVLTVSAATIGVVYP